MNHLILAALVLSSLMTVSRAARADGLSLEGGFNAQMSFPTGSYSDTIFGGAGFEGQVNYEFERWGIGIRGFGGVSTVTDFGLSSNGELIQGQLSRRQYGIEPLVRYFFPNDARQKRWYLEFGAAAMQTDFIHAHTVYVLPQSADYTRIFIQGSAFSIGAGYRPAKGPWFYQLNYRVERYEEILIVGDVNYLHPVLSRTPLNPTYFISNVIFTVGLDVFGR